MKPWKHLRQTQDTSEALPWNAETRHGDVYNFTTKGQVEYQKEALPLFEQFSDRSHRFRTKQRKFQIPLGRTMPDPRYGIAPHYPAKYYAAMTAVPDYKEAPHLKEYQWDSTRERHRLPDDMVATLTEHKIADHSETAETMGQTWPAFRGYPLGACQTCGHTLNDDVCINACPQSFPPSYTNTESSEPEEEENVFVYMLTTEEMIAATEETSSEETAAESKKKFPSQWRKDSPPWRETGTANTQRRWSWADPQHSWQTSEKDERGKSSSNKIKHEKYPTREDTVASRSSWRQTQQCAFPHPPPTSALPCAPGGGMKGQKRTATEQTGSSSLRPPFRLESPFRLRRLKSTAAE